MSGHTENRSLSSNSKVFVSDLLTKGIKVMPIRHKADGAAKKQKLLCSVLLRNPAFHAQFK